MSIEGQPDSTFGRIVDLNIPPLEYYGLVRHFNDLIQTELSKQLKDKAGGMNAIVTFVTPGSDGRREKGSLASPMEVIALVNAEVDIQDFENVLDNILQQTSETRISKVREVKVPSSKLSFFQDDPQRVQPGRIADSRLLVGDPKELEDAKKRLGKEIVDLPRNRIVDNVEQLQKSGRQTTERGWNRFRGQDVLHFDAATGTVFFNPDAHQQSFKIGPLRWIQNALLAEEVKHIRRENDPDFISRLHSGIVNRLGQLSDDRLLSLTRESVEELKEHYAFFLRLYHRSEEEYVQHGQVVYQLTPQENEEVARRIHSLQELMRKFKIQKQPG